MHAHKNFTETGLRLRHIGVAEDVRCPVAVEEDGFHARLLKKSLRLGNATTAAIW
jgi:hypothetical protein